MKQSTLNSDFEKGKDGLKITYKKPYKFKSYEDFIASLCPNDKIKHIQKRLDNYLENL